jgi:hypothetical protein
VAYGEKGGATLRLTEGSPTWRGLAPVTDGRMIADAYAKSGGSDGGEAREKALQMSAMPDVHVAPTTVIHWDEELRRDGIEMIAPHRANGSKPPT